MATDHTLEKRVTDGRCYLNTRYHQSCPNFADYVSRTDLVINYFRKYCQSFRDSVDNGSDVKTALDLGSGPCVSMAFLMHSYASRIVLAEYEQSNRDELQLWKSGSPQAFDWQTFLRAVLERNGDIPDGADIDSYVSRIITDVRQKVSSIVSCDLRKDPLFDPAVVPEGGFDLISVRNVLSVAATNMAEFDEMFKKVCSIMKKGAVFVCCLAGRASWYYMDPQSSTPAKLPLFYVTEDDTRRAVKDAQLELLEMNVREVPASTYQFCDIKEQQTFICRKPNSM